MRSIHSLIVAVSVFVAVGECVCAQDRKEQPPPVHVRNGFQFTVAAPIRKLAPLFGPDGERCWSGPEWNPEFLHPHPGKDIEGAVFTVQHGQHTSIWVNTRFDLNLGRMQYVSFVPEVLVSTVDVQLTEPRPVLDWRGRDLQPDSALVLSQ